jgi:acyl-homoserine-lactone acylase
MRGSLYELALDPEDPTRYRVDGVSRAMTRKVVTVPVRGADGAMRPVSHTFWISEFGPVLAGPQLPWTRAHAYALADAGRDNTRYLNQMVEIGQARDVRGLRDSLARTQGLFWLNTLAADAKGEALYADLSVVPDIPADLAKSCARKIAFPQATLVNVMDGSRSACRWAVDPRAATPGIMPSAEKPSLVTRTYVENSNASYWYVAQDHPLEGFSPIIGRERSPPTLRTRQGHALAQDLVAGGGADPAGLEAGLFGDRDLLADLVLDDLLAACARTPDVTLADGGHRDLTRPCAVLAAWDRKDELDSRGAQLFREFARLERPPGEEDAATLAGFWRIPFDPARPQTTPAGLGTSTPAPLQALAKAADRLAAAGVALDARLGDIQFITRGGARIALPGGLIFNRISLTLSPQAHGYTEPMGSAASYIQVVGFDDRGPVADTLLVNSQSGDPDSPWYADQAPLFAAKQWVRAPFHPADIRAAAIGPTTVLRYAPPVRR